MERRLSGIFFPRKRTGAAAFFLALALTPVPLGAAAEKMLETEQGETAAQGETTAQNEIMQSETAVMEADLTEIQESETQNWLDEMDEWMAEQEGSEADSETDMEEEDGGEYGEESGDESVSRDDGYFYEDMENGEQPGEEVSGGEVLGEELQYEEPPEELLMGELFALQEFDLDKYLPVTFVQESSSFEIFPQHAEFARVVKNGITMAAISPKSAEEQGQVGVYYRKAAVQGEKWYDLKITVAESAESEIVSKEGTLSVFSGIAFCTDRIGWGIEGRQERTVLKMEFIESDTGNAAAINARFMWKDIDLDNRPRINLEDGSFAAHYYVERQRKGRGNMVFLLNNCSTWYATFTGRGQTEFEVISQEDILTAGEESSQKETGSGTGQVKVMRREAQVRLFVSKRDPHTKQWDTDTVFEVYEWDGYGYGIYRGCLVYDIKKNCYIMAGLVRNEVNEGKYIITEAGDTEQASGWRQEILVPDRAVVTDLYYRVEN